MRRAFIVCFTSRVLKHFFFHRNHNQRAITKNFWSFIDTNSNKGDRVTPCIILEIKYNCVTIELWLKINRTVLFLMNVLFYVWYLCDHVYYLFVRLYAISMFAVLPKPLLSVDQMKFFCISKCLSHFHHDINVNVNVNVDLYRGLNRSIIPISQEIWSRFGVSNHISLTSLFPSSRAIKI